MRSVVFNIIQRKTLPGTVYDSVVIQVSDKSVRQSIQVKMIIRSEESSDGFFLDEMEVYPHISLQGAKKLTYMEGVIIRHKNTPYTESVLFLK